MFTVKQLASIQEIETGRRLTSVEFLDEINLRQQQLAEKFQVSSGKTILLLQNNSIDFFINLLALFQLGATVIPFDPLASRLEIETIRNHAHASLVISETDVVKTQFGGNEELKGVALLLYTSGTTGSPKAVMISYEALNKKMEILSRAISTREVDNSLCALPTYFGHGLICNSLFPILYGKNFYVAKKFDLLLCRDLPSWINKFDISFFSTVPSVWQMILNFSEAAEMPSLKRVHCASSPLSDDRAGEIVQWLGPKVHFYNIYGITEMLGWFACQKYSGSGSINEFNEFWDIEKKFSAEGELLVKAAYMFNGYFNNPDANSQGFTQDGFFKTGDLFENGCLKGRLSQVINKKGFKIYPEEINRFLMNTNLVSDCHSFGKKDEFSNEVHGVLVVMKHGYSIAQLKALCLKDLPVNKVPDFFIEIEKIDRNARGKISKDYIEKIVAGLK